MSLVTAGIRALINRLPNTRSRLAMKMC